MKMKKFCASLLCLTMLVSSLSISAFALDAGVYTGSVVTSYYNPDTGNVDDGGTANAALGDGMCRSATAKTGLVEKDADGNIWVTIRLLLQSNCKNVAFYTRTGYDTYSQVSYDIMAEDSANDSIDYRFKVSDAGVKIKGTMYVTPMGRDVLWYLYVDTSTLASGSGDFEVSIDVGEPEATPSPAEPSAPATPSPAEPSVPATPSPSSPTTPEPSPSTAVPVNGAAGTETPAPEPSAPENPVTEESQDPAPEETDIPENTPPANEEDTPRTAAPEQEPDKSPNRTGEPADEASEGEVQTSGGIGGGAIAAIVLVLVLAVGAVIYFIKRKK